MLSSEPILQIVLITLLMAFTGVIVASEATFWEIISTIILAGSAYSLALVQSKHDNSGY